MSIHFNELNINQIAELQQVARQSFLDAYEKDTNPSDMASYLDETFSIEQLKKNINHKKIKYFLVQYKNNIVGYLKLRWDRTHEHFNHEKTIELERIYLLKEYWNQKIGSQMIQFTINFAKENQFKWIWLLVWNENKKGIQFYERHGFIFFGKKYFYFGKDSSLDFLYKKEILYI